MTFLSQLFIKNIFKSKILLNEIHKINYCSQQLFKQNEINTSNLIFNNNCDNETKQIIKENMLIYDNFLSNEEEENLLSEINQFIKRQRYEHDHWDDAIHGFRETERSQWNNSNTKIIERVKQLAFPSSVTPLQFVHVLDLEDKGYIKPHVDSVRFCGNTIAGLSLLTNSVMKLVDENTKSKEILILLKQRSLYVMKNEARFNFTHEILENEKSYFGNVHIPKTRRISVICRNAPDPKYLKDNPSNEQDKGYTR